MNTPTSMICQRCAGKIVIDYIRLGAAMRCPHCLYRTVPEVPAGGMIPKSGYQMTYRDFLQLLEDSGNRQGMAALLKSWFDFKVEQSSDGVFIFHGDVAINPLWLHLQIQSDAARQSELYNLAMTLWR